MMTATIGGTAELAATLKELSQSVLSRTALEAANTGAAVFETAARAYARSSKDTGNLLNSIGVRVRKVRKSSSIAGVIGPRRGFKITAPDGSVRDAAANANLTEFGHMAKNGKQVAAKPFMRPAFANAKSGAMNQMAAVFKKRFESVVAKLARKRARGK